MEVGVIRATYETAKGSKVLITDSLSRNNGLIKAKIKEVTYRKPIYIGQEADQKPITSDSNAVNSNEVNFIENKSSKTELKEMKFGSELPSVDPKFYKKAFLIGSDNVSNLNNARSVETTETSKLANGSKKVEELQNNDKSKLLETVGEVTNSTFNTKLSNSVGNDENKNLTWNEDKAWDIFSVKLANMIKEMTINIIHNNAENYLKKRY